MESVEGPTARADTAHALASWAVRTNEAVGQCRIRLSQMSCSTPRFVTRAERSRGSRLAREPGRARRLAQPRGRAVRDRPRSRRSMDEAPAAQTPRGRRLPQKRPRIRAARGAPLVRVRHDAHGHHHPLRAAAPRSTRALPDEVGVDGLRPAAARMRGTRTLASCTRVAKSTRCSRARRMQSRALRSARRPDGVRRAAHPAFRGAGLELWRVPGYLDHFNHCDMRGAMYVSPSMPRASPVTRARGAGRSRRLLTYSISTPSSRSIRTRA